MNRKFMVVLLILIARSLFIFSVVNGKPNRITAIDTIDVDSSNRAKRDVVAIAAVSVIYGVSLASMSISNSNKCSVDAGCKSGKCWAWCGVSLSSGEWCYTTKSYSQSYAYVPCTSDYDCDKCWKCGGPCTL